VEELVKEQLLMETCGPARSVSSEPKYPMATLPPSPRFAIVLFVNVQSSIAIAIELAATLGSSTIDTAPGE